MWEESVIYQDISQKGELRGAKKFVQRMLERRFGKLSKTIQQNIEQLVIDQIEALAEALLDFKTKDDLTLWLNRHAPAPGKRS